LVSQTTLVGLFSLQHILPQIHGISECHVFFVAKKVAFHNSNHNRFIRLGNKALDRLGLVWAVWVFLQE